MKRYCFAILLWMLAFAFAGDSIAEDIIHKRLIWTDSPQSRAVVCWDTVTEGKDHRVYYDTESRNAAIKAYKDNQPSTASGAYSMSEKDKAKEPELYYHHAQLTDLKPDTTYYFVMVSDDAISEEHHFRTAPAKDGPLKIIFGGDSRSGVSDRRRINQLIAKTVEDDSSVLAFAHGGDYVGSGMNFAQWKSWMKDHELTITASQRMVPLIPARGNHEGRGPLYDQMFAFPGGEGTNYFATQLSPEIFFLTLNTCKDPAGLQKEFLETSLSSASGIRWRVAQYHRPLYPAVKNTPKAFEHWVPLFEKYNVALACEADGHCIKRTVPIRAGKLDPTGVVYIGEGGLGVGQRTPKTDRWYVKAPGMVGKGHHFQLLSFTENYLSIAVVGIDGKIIDTHKITADRSAQGQ